MFVRVPFETQTREGESEKFSIQKPSTIINYLHHADSLRVGPVGLTEFPGIPWLGLKW